MKGPFGKYIIQKELGKGGMGVVYQAHDPILNRKIAIKILNSKRTQKADDAKRFLEEARHAAKINHTHVVAIYDTGTIEDIPFIAMELVVGETLAAHLKKSGVLPSKKARDFLRQATQGLAQIHTHNMIHRDIKPANLLLSHKGPLKITDFGIVSDLEKSKKPQDDTVIGTLGYIAPEIYRGKTPDVRSDIFSLGAVFYEMLTGDLPSEDFGLPTNSKTPGHQRFAKLESNDRKLLRRMLDSNPSRRFHSCSELLESLNHSPQGPYRPAKTASKKKPIRYQLGKIIVLIAFLMMIPLFKQTSDSASQQDTPPLRESSQSQPLNRSQGSSRGDSSGLGPQKPTQIPSQNPTGPIDIDALDTVEAQPDGFEYTPSKTQTVGEAPSGLAPEDNGVLLTQAAKAPGIEQPEEPTVPQEPIFPTPHDSGLDTCIVAISGDEHLQKALETAVTNALPKNTICWPTTETADWYNHVGEAQARQRFAQAGLELLIVIRFEEIEKTTVGDPPIDHIKGQLHIAGYFQNRMLDQFPFSKHLQYTKATLTRESRAALSSIETRIQTSLQEQAQKKDLLTLTISAEDLWHFGFIDILKTYFPHLTIRSLAGDQGPQKALDTALQYGARWHLQWEVNKAKPTDDVPEIQQEEILCTLTLFQVSSKLAADTQTKKLTYTPHTSDEVLRSYLRNTVPTIRAWMRDLDPK